MDYFYGWCSFNWYLQGIAVEWMLCPRVSRCFDIPFYLGCCLGEWRLNEVGSQRLKTFRSLLTLESYWSHKDHMEKDSEKAKKMCYIGGCVCFLSWMPSLVPLLWSGEKSLDGNETPRRQKVPICRSKRGRWKDNVLYWKKSTYIKNKEYKGLSAYSDQTGQIEINYVWLKKLLLQPWSILKSTLEDISHWLSNYHGWQQSVLKQNSFSMGKCIQCWLTIF